jgi:hypothetical protein
MGVARRVILPAVLATIPAQIALVMVFGNRPVASLLDDPIVDWAETITILGALIALGYWGIVLPASTRLAGRRFGNMATVLLLLLAAALGGAAMLAFLLVPALFSGADLIGLIILAPLGSMVGVIATTVWLPFNADIFGHSAES